MLASFLPSRSSISGATFIMSQTNKPPAGTPRVHHPGAKGQQGPVQPATDDQISLADYKNAAVSDYLLSHLPTDGIVFVNGEPEAAPKDKPPAPTPVKTPE